MLLIGKFVVFASWDGSKFRPSQYPSPIKSQMKITSFLVLGLTLNSFLSINLYGLLGYSFPRLNLSALLLASPKMFLELFPFIPLNLCLSKSSIVLLFAMESILNMESSNNMLFSYHVMEWHQVTPSKAWYWCKYTLNLLLGQIWGDNAPCYAQMNMNSNFIHIMMNKLEQKHV